MKRAGWLILCYVLAIQFVGAATGGFIAHTLGPDEARQIIMDAIDRTLGPCQG